MSQASLARGFTCGPTSLGPRVWVFILFFEINGTNNALSILFFTKTIDDVLSIIVLKNCWKNGVFVFSIQKIIFNSFLTQNIKKHLGTLFNQSLTLKNAKKKKVSKFIINLEPKIFYSSNIFFNCFQGKKTFNLNLSHYMEQFDAKIGCFSNQDCCQW